ncbi:thioredoxin domain-containing protein [Thiohalomonas denitrificans]|uniref:Spermatogenesis-associated protein 20-like TRX domain-containing protein n=1 Tax=Thiohalomonas denitrificans TaxID=415747 RepID=A0A1G5QAY7_9GAMM|nr:thioredoxin domain-containing protein [Thiohalomonas denitrificans]SCZ58429.1 hypothetical protein SAMN03097708_01698 [Thiohalomonas denitrificans]
MVHRNRLAKETSPYLLQHADNPVDWYPWGDEALGRARREDRPILLSIGYSACHWCHVMAHESFENPETAHLMNEHFVNIKVDREERPDLDRIYQTAHQYLTRRPGGWPLTLFLTPDQIPFAAGTYFPPNPRHGLPAFPDILQRVADFFHERRDAIEEQNESLQEALQGAVDSRVAGLPDDGPLRRARHELEANFDHEHGGLGTAPKFPHAHSHAFLLRQAARHNDNEARDIALNSLAAMVSGGLFDQIGGGFFRYAVDARWEIPHFEKMLYDNGPLLSLCIDAWQVSGEERFRRAAVLTAEWVLREMQSPEGGYYATLDADSGGQEGGFYLWTREAAREALEPDDFRLAAAAYGLDQSANFEGQWHLTRRPSIEALAESFDMASSKLERRLEAIRQRLFAAREQRQRPGRDEKVLTSWNGLMISAMADAGRRLNEPRFTASAERALDFIRTRLTDNGRLMAVYKDGQARLSGYLDDYAFLADGVVSLLEARWRDGDLNFALDLTETLQEHFQDHEAGGFFFTADDHEALILRPKPFMDESTPSGNGIAARALLTLGHLTGRTDLLDAAEETLQAGWNSLSEVPSIHGALLHALEDYLMPPQQVILRGEDRGLQEWQDRLAGHFAPHRLVFSIPAGARDLPGLLAERPADGGQLAYVCGAHRCAPPVRDFEALERTLERTGT